MRLKGDGEGEEDGWGEAESVGDGGKQRAKGAGSGATVVLLRQAGGVEEGRLQDACRPTRMRSGHEDSNTSTRIG